MVIINDEGVLNQLEALGINDPYGADLPKLKYLGIADRRFNRLWLRPDKFVERGLRRLREGVTVEID